MLFTVAVINQAFFISLLFSNPKQAGELGSLLQNLGAMVYYLLFYLDSPSEVVYYLSCLFPQTALSLSLMHSLDIKQSTTGTYSTLGVNLMLLFDCVFYWALYITVQKGWSCALWRKLTGSIKRLRPRHNHLLL